MPTRQLYIEVEIRRSKAANNICIHLRPIPCIASNPKNRLFVILLSLNVELWIFTSFDWKINF